MTQPFTGGIPPSPLSPVPRIRRISTVSALSSAVWAVAILPGREHRKAYLASRAAFSSPFCPGTISPREMFRGISSFSHSSRTKISSLWDSSPRRQWLKCAASSRIPSLSRSRYRAYSSATESAPPERAQITVSPRFISPCCRMKEQTLFSMLPLPVGKGLELGNPLQLHRAGLAVTVF